MIDIITVSPRLVKTKRLKIIHVGPLKIIIDVSKLNEMN